MTDQYGVIGHPIAHSRSPVIHQQFAKQTNQDISYVAIDIAPEALDHELERLVAEGMLGLNVTVPHKSSVAELMDELSDRARLAGAVNTIIVGEQQKLTGDNTDGVGLVRDLRRNLGLDLAGIQILILGAGGATRGIVPALLDRGPTEILIANRTMQKAHDLAAEFGELGDISACRFDALEGHVFDLVINATSGGLSGNAPPPFPPSIIDYDVVCYDLSYAMRTTPFCAWAREQGAHKVHQGWGMLIEQAAESFYIWRGVRPDAQAVRKFLPL